MSMVVAATGERLWAADGWHELAVGGLCARCRSAPTDDDDIFCVECRDWLAECHRTRRAIRRSLGLCVQCGADAGGLHLCETHRMIANAARRRRRRALPGRVLKPCGTLAAYQRHYRRSEEPCDPCRAARSEYDRVRRAA